MKATSHPLRRYNALRALGVWAVLQAMTVAALAVTAARHGAVATAGQSSASRGQSTTPARPTGVPNCQARKSGDTLCRTFYT
jgi:hypothetical protein